jgi:putative oxidoreductase
MDLLRAVARPMLGAIFVYSGLESMQAPHTKVPQAALVVEPLIDELDLPGDTATWVRVNGFVQVVAGAVLSAGRFPRLAALTLAVSLVPTTVAGHRFWEEADDAGRTRQRIQFLKNMSMLGGLLIAADDTGGRPSIPWRIHRAADQAFEHLPVVGAD